MPSKNEIAATMTRGQAAREGVISAPEAQEKITANSKRLFGFTRKMLPPAGSMPTEPKQYLYSVSEYGDTVNLGPGFPLYEIKACPDGEEYGEACVIPPIIFFEEAKVDVTEHTFHSGPQIVEAILKIGPGMNASWDRRKVGWFVSNTNPPSAEDVRRATTLYIQECTRLLQEGNRYASANQLLEINETHRRAAKYLGQKVEWSKPLQQMRECPGCGENVRVGIIWHAFPMGCGYIFDRESYEEHFAPQVQAHKPAPPQPTK
jgi:hypothetical protein